MDARAAARATASYTQLSQSDEQDSDVDRCAETIPLDPAEFVPRAIAPEATSNLQTLRAVANTSARSAIDKHQRQRYEKLALIFWGVAVVALMVCGSLAVWVDNIFSLTTYASMAGLLVSIYAVSRALMYTAKAKFGAHATHKTLAENGFNITIDQDVDEEQESPAAFLDPTFGALPAVPSAQPEEVAPVVAENAPAGQQPELPTLSFETASPMDPEIQPPAVEPASDLQSPAVPTLAEPSPNVPPDAPTLVVDNEKGPS